MTEQHEREWPSFGDILEELNSLGRLPSTLAAPPSSSNPLDHSHPETVEQPTAETDETIETVETVETSAPELATTAEAEELVVELAAEPNWAPTETLDHPSDDETVTSGEIVPAEEIAPIEDADAAEQVVSGVPVDAIDWSSWDFEAAPPPADALLQDFTIESRSDVAETSDPMPIFEFEIGNESDGPIDSVATADAIETDLHELFGMVDEDETADLESSGDDSAEDAVDTDAVDTIAETADESVESVESDGKDIEAVDEGHDDTAGADNVVPLHRPGDDLTHHLVGLDDVFDPSATPEVEPTARTAEFVGIEQPPPKKADSWEYLRPGEDDSVKSGILARRPKFFGGAERKARKTERKQAEAKAELTGPPCPKCDSPGRIDLNDPVGGKIHCSCLDCDHVWSELAPPTRESA